MQLRHCHFNWAALALGLGASACDDQRPPHYEDPGADAGMDATLDVRLNSCNGPPAPDARGYCGNEVVPVLTERPNVYFVLDASGSMADGFRTSVVSKLHHAQLAIHDLLAEIGHRVNYGAALFPAEDEEDGCARGEEVFPTEPGDTVYCDDSPSGSVLDRFLSSIGNREPGGGTPIAPTVEGISDTLLALPGRTSLVLITDGGPNCVAAGGCSPEECLPNIEQNYIGGDVCGIDIDCCDPNLLGPDAVRGCVDAVRSERVIAELNEQGVLTYVIGMPGSEFFATVLDDMAQAGGTARTGAETEYYSVVETGDLSLALAAIGSEISLNCRITLESEPTNPDFVNVYLDDQLVESDASNGWRYADDAVVELVGSACTELESGTVSQVQIVEGCPTIIK